MRVELRMGLMLSGLGSIVSHYPIFNEPVLSFLHGACLSLGVFFMAVNFLPKKMYDKLLYRKWIVNKNI